MGSNIQSASPEGAMLVEQQKWKCAEDSARYSARTLAAGKLSPLMWLSVSCLDAPIVAVTWQWLFARSLHAHISLADRVTDSFTVPPNGLTSARQRW